MFEELEIFVIYLFPTVGNNSIKIMQVLWTFLYLFKLIKFFLSKYQKDIYIYIYQKEIDH